MCLVALAVTPEARYPLVVAANRDEFFARPSAVLGWWAPGPEGAPPVLGGRDLQQGGTWLGVTAPGRLALLTNVREPGRHDAAAPSRGSLVPRWLRGDLEDAEALDAHLRAAPYNGCNVIAGDFRGATLFHASNRAPPSALGAGVHGLSNAGLNTPWPKVEALRARLAASLVRNDDVDALCAALFAALADRTAPDDAELPDTGVPREWERLLSPAFIHAPQHGYGTRCSTLLIVEAAAAGGTRLHVRERTFDAGAADERRFALDPWPT